MQGTYERRITHVTFITNRQHVTMFHGHCTVDTVPVFTGAAEAPTGGAGASVYRCFTAVCPEYTITANSLITNHLGMLKM